jgi:serine protease Do
MKRRMIFFSVLMLANSGFFHSGFCQSKSQSGAAAAIKDLSASLADLARKVHPSVVQIRTVGFGAVDGQLAGTVASQSETGSGVILDSEGFIITNAHVVKGARHIEVWFSEPDLPNGSSSDESSQKRLAAARLIGTDQDEDLAVIKVDRSGLQPLSLADSSSLRQGQIVLAFGNPMTLEDSVTMGIISSVERRLSPDDLVAYIQTDAPINPGNSGGPLIDADGRLVGISTFILSQSGGSEGIGFAIPAKIVKRVYMGLRKEGRIHHGHIGILATDVTPQLATGLGLAQDRGVILEDVEPEGPADKAGMQPGDVVTAVDGEIIRDLHQLLMAINQHPIGEAMKMDLLRGKNKTETKVIVEERPDDSSHFTEMIVQKSQIIPQLGILAIDIDDSMVKMIPERRKPAGILVAARVAGLAGAEEGFAYGDLIISLNGKDVPNIETMRNFLTNIQTGNPIVFQIQREDELRFVVLESP